MHPELGRRFDKFEKQKASLLSQVSRWTPEQLSFRPQPDGWSTLDVLDHLVKVETGFLKEGRNIGKQPDPSGFQHWLRAWAVVWVMRSPLRVKVPASAMEVMPRPLGDLATITSQWTRVRQIIAEFLASLPPDALRRGAFHHPVSGWLTPVQTITFLSAHLQHHEYQIRRLERSAAKI